ncbi:hypothetical protein [Hymenobacter sp. BT190]|uniref:hypothetical protein n=1 Tax=Hymenobacter sp. BT190 TaxID=2763505 RepID=UPI00165126D4|nr:hypothetical protein [Hymenobacter sp. BT190]MBC6697894.1 hypothetical protein [Hymenobacter sp. BT190]
MFALLCRLSLILVFVVLSVCSAFTVAAQPFFRLPILRTTVKQKPGKIHRPVYRTYKVYRQY